MKSSSSSLENFTVWNSLITKGDLSLIQTMIEKGDLSYRDSLGQFELSPLHLAVWHNQPEICKFLISGKISPNIDEPFSGKTPLHIAAYFGHLEVAKTLTTLGAKLDGRKSVDILGCHPLHYAALGEQEKMIFFFLGLCHLTGPLGSQTKFSGKTVSCIGNILDILIKKRNLALCDLISAAEGISIVETDPRRESALYVGYYNENPWTPFHSAAVLGERKIVEMLLRRFPHAYCLSKEFAHLFDYSPGEVALIEGHVEIAHLLGETRTVTSYRKTFNHLSTIQNATSYSKDLLKAIEEKDFTLLDKLIAKHGKEILYQGNFYEPLDNAGISPSFYCNSNNLNAFSVVARLFCIPFAQWLKEKNIEIAPQEFLERDQKETVFFNWSMLDIHPYATQFFEKTTEEINSLSS